MAKADFLKKRAKEFLKAGSYHLKKTQYNLAAFNFEQAVQLYLKYCLFQKLADFPKTHSLRDLLFDIGKVYQKEKEIKKLVKENSQIISDLEEAYITSRYLPVEFSKEQIRVMEDFTKNLIKFLKKL